MHSVESIAAEIVRREGGYVNDPDDPGGATNHGVTLHTMQGLRLDLTRDGKVDVARRQGADAGEGGGDLRPPLLPARRSSTCLPEPLQASVFDMQVNAGANAVRILQRLMAAFGLPLKDDGVIGPVTARTVARAMEAAPDHLVDAYGIARRNYYYRLADQRPASRKYARAQRRRQGRLDHPRRGVHLRALPPHPRGARREGGGMGLIGTILGAGGAARRSARRSAASPRSSSATAPSATPPRAARRSPRVGQFGAEFAARRRGRFDGFVNGAQPAAAAAAGARHARALRLRHGGARRASRSGCRASRWCPSRSGGCSAPSSPSTSAPASCTTSAPGPAPRGRGRLAPPQRRGGAAPVAEPLPQPATPRPRPPRSRFGGRPDYNAAVEEWRRLHA